MQPDKNPSRGHDRVWCWGEEFLKERIVLDSKLKNAIRCFDSQPGRKPTGRTSSGGLNYRKRESFSEKTEQEETEVSTIKFEIDGKQE